MKICSKCKLSKPKFYKNKISNDGLQSQCSDCHQTGTRAGTRRWQEKNKERRYKEIKRWKKENPDKVMYYIRRRKKAIKERTPQWLSKETIAEMLKVRYMISDYNKKNHTDMSVDHIIPLLGKNVSGLHVPWNLQIISKTDNLKKSNNIL